MNQKKLGKLRFKNLIVLLLAMSFITLSVTSQSSVTAAAKVDISKPVQLKWYVVGNGQQTDIDLVEDEINKYLKEKLNATLKLTTYTWGDDFENRMASKIASGTEFDITFTANWALDYIKNSKNKAFVDITNMMDTYAPKTKALLGKNILKGAKVNGRLYAIPSYSNNFTSYGVLLNKDMVTKYNVDTSKIKKLSDLEPIFKKIKAKEPKVIEFYPFDYYGTDTIYDSLGFEKLARNRVPGAVKRDGKSTKVINDYDSSDAKALFSLMHKWYKSGYIKNNIPSDIFSDDREEFFDNNVSNIFAFSSSIYPMKSQEFYARNEVETVAVTLTKPAISTNNTTGTMQAISTTSKNPERALMLLELVNTDEKLSNMINFGIEGVHYKKTGAKSIKQISPRFEDYNPGLSWLFGNQSIAYSLPIEDPKLWNEVKSITTNAVPSPLLGFTFNSYPVASQINKLQNIVDKYYYPLSMGKIDPAVNLPKMNKELKNAGLQKVLTEMQKQVDAFKKSESK